MSDSISILFPLKRQQERFLAEALESVLNQEDGNWKLLALLDPETPRPERRLLESAHDPRIERIEVGAPGFARALNHGLHAAGTEFATILLSDDRLHPSTVGALRHYRGKHPDADFFHSSRRLMDENGTLVGPVMPARRHVDPTAFAGGSSPVKHLLCWRIQRSLEIGGMDEELSPHGCDDRDFPWRMAEAGCRFVPVKECLYEYRVHTGERLTTSVPVNVQIQVLEKMARKHGVEDRQIASSLQGAVDRYLVDAHDGLFGLPESRTRPRHLSAAAPSELRDTFLQAGFRRKHFFPHRTVRVNRGGPDGYLLAERVIRRPDPAQLRQVILYALPEAVGSLPRDLFFDRELQWHEQHCGEPWQVGWASLAVDQKRRRLTVLTAVSDLVQRSARRQEHRTQIDNRFRGWMYMLWNAVLDYAVDLGVREVRIPTSQLILQQMIDPTRNSKAPMYQRIYDTSVEALYATTLERSWRIIDVEQNRDHVVRLQKQVQPRKQEKTVCIIHDTERGLGHADLDARLAASMDGPSRKALEEMLRIEAAAGVRTTYNVVGNFLKEVEAGIRAQGHAVAFHSYDHQLVTRLRKLPWRLRRMLLGVRAAGSQWGQVLSCRRVDSRIKGYRPPQSRLEDLTPASLSYRNFEWLASSTGSLGTEVPDMENGVVRIPVHIDDFPLYKGRTNHEAWEQEILDLVAQRDFVTIGLHDCYAPFWLPRYRDLLEKLRTMASLRTCDEVAGQVALDTARWI